MRGSMASILSRVCPMREPQAEPDAHESGGGGRREAFGKEDRCQLSGPTRRCYHPPRDRRLTLVDPHHHFWDPPTNPDARCRRGYARLGRHGLSYDLQAPFERRAEAAGLARDFPDTRIVVNHTGLPVDHGEDGLKAWRRALETVAAQPSVALKVSGLGGPDQSWPVEANRRVVRDAIAIFGVARCLFASNYPVDSLCASFDAIFRAFDGFTADLPEADRRALFSDNARRIYRMDEAPPG